MPKYEHPANRLKEEFKSTNTEIDWEKMRGFRNRIIYEYFGIDIEIVWQIIEDDIDALITLHAKKLK